MTSLYLLDEFDLRSLDEPPLVREELGCVALIVVYFKAELNAASKIKARAKVDCETTLFHFNIQSTL